MRGGGGQALTRRVLSGRAIKSAGRACCTTGSFPAAGCVGLIAALACLARPSALLECSSRECLPACSSRTTHLGQEVRCGRVATNCATAASGGRAGRRRHPVGAAAAAPTTSFTPPIPRLPAALPAAMSAELAIEKLRKMQRKLSMEETGPELADMLAILEGIQLAEAELREAAAANAAQRQSHGGMDGADQSPVLFKVGGRAGRLSGRRWCGAAAALRTLPLRRGRSWMAPWLQHNGHACLSRPSLLHPPQGLLHLAHAMLSGRGMLVTAQFSEQLRQLLLTRLLAVSERCRSTQLHPGAGS